MKELYYKRELSDDRRKKYISFQSCLENCGSRIEIHKNYSYDIKEERVIRSQAEFNDIVKKIHDGDVLSHLYIKKIVDSESGKTTLSYIGKGEFFALYKNKVYRVLYKHEHVVEAYPVQ
ncbi:MAG: hypothetical protein P9X27_06600 [Candidatus Kaelpia aquatica]|nr:hypothetical protein [Candidatus Kaelpia aquatica]